MGSPSKKKRPTVPRLGLSMSFKGEGPGRSNRDAFALGDLGVVDDDEHRMLNRGIIQN
jgi:hypothetical protein